MVWEGRNADVGSVPAKALLPEDAHASKWLVLPGPRQLGDLLRSGACIRVGMGEHLSR